MEKDQWEFPRIACLDGLNPTVRPPGGFTPGTVFVDTDGVLKRRDPNRTYACDKAGQRMNSRTLARPPSCKIGTWAQIKSHKEREAKWIRFFQGLDPALTVEEWRAELPLVHWRLRRLHARVRSIL